MTARMGVMARKVAMLSAAGRSVGPTATRLLVTMADAESAIKVVQRWIGYAQAFDARTEESTFEVLVQKCIALAKGRTVNRRDVARMVHASAKTMREIEETLVMRDLIDVQAHKPKTGRPSFRWTWL